MSPRIVPTGSDAVGRRDRPLRITVDGEPMEGVDGQTLAGVMLAAGRLSWRRGPSGAPRGVFCGIGVCFDCLVTVGQERDVRACRRRAREGDVVSTQSRLPDPPVVAESTASVEARGRTSTEGSGAADAPTAPTTAGGPTGASGHTGPTGASGQTGAQS
ncbi:(2Fe-2S)-binding protein [Streptomyces sp. NPDC096176]|uniref:(2Fe-2S)-binding protein n=1 Tax=Streptomyces sp. NPDC096176 TaxID=3366079 RepID=UPI0038211E80